MLLTERFRHRWWCFFSWACCLVLCCVGSPHVFGTQVTVSVASPNFSHFVLSCPCPLCSSSHWSWACGLFTKMSGFDFCPCPCFEHVSMGQLPHPSVHQTTQRCAVRALMPLLALLPPHVCHRQRDWAVSMDSHMQQDIDISKAPPHLGAPIPLFEHRSRLKTTIQKIGDNFSRNTVVFCKCSNASFPHRRAPHVQNHAHMHIGSHLRGHGKKKIIRKTRNRRTA